MGMKKGDIIKIVEFPGSKYEGPSKLKHIHNEIGLLLIKTSESIAMDWGACWAILIRGERQDFCYERWLEVISESR